MRRSFILFLFISLMASSTFAQDWSKLYEDTTKKHFVVVELESDTMKPPEGAPKFHCSGVVVAINQVLSAAHCVVNENGIFKGVVNNKPTRILKIDVERDLVLLDALTSKKSPIVIPFTGPKPGAQVASIGLAYGDKEISISPQHIINYDHGYLHTNIVFFGGWSGGPLIDSKGYLAGIMVMTHTAVYAMSVPIVDIRKFLYEDSQTEGQTGLRDSILGDGQR